MYDAAPVGSGDTANIDNTGNPSGQVKTIPDKHCISDHVGPKYCNQNIAIAAPQVLSPDLPNFLRKYCCGDQEEECVCRRVHTRKEKVL